MEFHELNQRLSQIYEKLREAREDAETSQQLLDTLMLDLVRENTLREDKEEQDGGSDTIQR